MLLIPSSASFGDDWDLILQSHLPRLGLDPGPKFAQSHETQVLPNATTVLQLDEWTDASTAIEQAVKDKDMLVDFQIRCNLCSKILFTTRADILVSQSQRRKEIS